MACRFCRIIFHRGLPIGISQENKILTGPYDRAGLAQHRGVGFRRNGTRLARRQGYQQAHERDKRDAGHPKATMSYTSYAVRISYEVGVHGSFPLRPLHVSTPSRKDYPYQYCRLSYFRFHFVTRYVTAEVQYQILHLA